MGADPSNLDAISHDGYIPIMTRAASPLPHIVIQHLTIRPHGFALAVSAGGVPAVRLTDWLKRGVVAVSDLEGRGRGNRREFSLLDIAAIRLTAMLTDPEHGIGLGLQTASEIVKSCFYGDDPGMRAFGVGSYRNKFEIEAQAARVFESRWIVASRVHYLEPDIRFWCGELCGFHCDTAGAALDAVHIANPRDLPAQKIVIEIGPALRELVRALLLARGEEAAFPGPFTDKGDIR